MREGEVFFWFVVVAFLNQSVFELINFMSFHRLIKMGPTCQAPSMFFLRIKKEQQSRVLTCTPHILNKVWWHTSGLKSVRILKETRKLLCPTTQYIARGNTQTASAVLLVSDYTSLNHSSDNALRTLNQLLIESRAFSYQWPCYIYSIPYYAAFTISYFIYRLST